LQFVVIVLGAETKMLSGGSASAFRTPTVVHFCGVLFLCAVLSAPWGNGTAPAVALGAGGIAGVVYSVVVVFPLMSYAAVIMTTMRQRHW
jgi:hypothetical protein